MRTIILSLALALTMTVQAADVSTQIDPLLDGETITAVAYRGVTVLDTATCSHSNDSGLYFVAATLDLSGAGAGYVRIAFIDAHGQPVSTGAEAEIDGSGAWIDRLAYLDQSIASVDATADVADIKAKTDHLPSAAAGSNGGLPTVDANNRIAGIAGTITTLDALDTAQDSQHTATQSAIGDLPTANAVRDAVWANSTRTLTAGTNIVLAKGTGITGFNDPSTVDIADAVAGSDTISDISNEVHAMYQDGVTVSLVGSGAILSSSYDEGAITALQSGLAKSSATASIGENIGTLLAVTQVTLPNQITDATSGLYDIGLDLAEVKSNVTDILEDTETTIPATLGAPAGASISADIAAVKSETASIEGKVDNIDFSAVLSAIEAVEEQLDELEVDVDLGPVLEAIEGVQESVGGLSASGRYTKDRTIPARTWHYSRNTESATSPNTITESYLFSGEVCFDLNNALNEGAGIDGISSITVSPEGPTIGDARKTSDNKKVFVPISGHTQGVEYTYTLSVSTTDSDPALVRKGKFKAE